MTIVQKDKHRFSNGRVDPICPLSGVGDEDIEHTLYTEGPIYKIQRIGRLVYWN